uniref:Sema domain-containing protein n=1 Tax=Globodera pallida TaxID=36090 RepID=A0A183C410_GLOPA
MEYFWFLILVLFFTTNSLDKAESVNVKLEQTALKTFDEIFGEGWWDKEPQFVASHSVGPHVFFFFRETLTTDCYNCPSAGTGKGTTVSRNDLGGRQVLRQVWTSFVKARLNCSLPGGFYFDRIQSVSRVDESLTSAEASTSTGGDTFFYATFTAADQSALRASAVCVFSLSAINQLFDSGLFLEQSVSGSGSWWNPTPADQMPTSRPGTCQSDSRQLSDEELHFAKSHLLMAESVPSLGGSPLLHRHDVLLTQIVADVPDRDGRIVLFAYDLGQFGIAQFRLGQCAVYGSNCAQCARDPYCSWSITRRQCFPTDSSHSDAVGWIVSRGASAAATFSSVDDEMSERCAKHAKAVTMTVFPGDSVHLECPDGEQMVQWRHNGRKVTPENTGHLVHSRSGGLVLLNATEALEGVYECATDASESAKAKVPLAIYSLKVDGDCARPKSVEQFRSAQREWCRRMDAYRNNLSKWQSVHEANGQGESDCGIGAETERRTAENFAA